MNDQQGQSEPAGDSPEGKTRAKRIAEKYAQDPHPIQVGSIPETIRVLKQEINAGAIPDAYVTDGRLTLIEHVSGTANPDAGDRDLPLAVTSTPVTPPVLAHVLATHTYTYKVEYRKGKDDAEGTERETEVTPPQNALQAVLANKTWPGLPALRGIIGAPVLRGDGTLLQHPGYDQRTGLYLAPTVTAMNIPEAPTKAQIAEARTFLLDKFLHDFPWVSDADRANYIALMVTPILRRYLRALTPFGIITATMPGSGKTILTSGPGLLYGQRVFAWTDSEEELRKTITSALDTVEGTMIFDNLAEGAVIKSAVLGNLLTSPVWSDRRLGGNKVASQQNDRLWLATGNNLAVGADMASRSVWVRIDPKIPRPEKRAKFALGPLDVWISKSENQQYLLWCLLVLIVGWTRAGAQRARGAGTTMRNFTPWAEGVGGFLAHHRIDGFLANAEEARDGDEDDSDWTIFLSAWFSRFAGERKTAVEARKSAEVDYSFGVEGRDPWDGAFITDDRGRRPNAKALGALMRGQVGRFHGDYVLRKLVRKHDKVCLWWVEKNDEKNDNTAQVQAASAGPCARCGWPLDSDGHTVNCESPDAT